MGCLQASGRKHDHQPHHVFCLQASWLQCSMCAWAGFLLCGVEWCNAAEDAVICTNVDATRWRVDCSTGVMRKSDTAHSGMLCAIPQGTKLPAHSKPQLSTQCCSVT
eukprot:1157351-Pelagomonas_calceolata.AAC.4